MHTLLAFYIKTAIMNLILSNIDLDQAQRVRFAARQREYYKAPGGRSVPALQFGTKRKQRRAFNDIVTGIPSRDQRWFLQAVADGNQRRMLDVGCRAFGWVVLFQTICHSGKPTTPFASLAPSRVSAFFSHSPPSRVFIAANRRNMPTRSLRHSP